MRVPPFSLKKIQECCLFVADSVGVVHTKCVTKRKPKNMTFLTIDDDYEMLKLIFCFKQGKSMEEGYLLIISANYEASPASRLVIFRLRKWDFRVQNIAQNDK